MAKDKKYGLEDGIDRANTWYLVKRVSREYVFPHYKAFFVSILLMLVIAGTTALHAYLVKPALDAVFVEKRPNALIYIPIIVLIVTVVKGFATYFQLLIMNVISLKMTADLRIKMYGHFVKSDIAKLHSRSSGDMMASIMYEIGLIVGMVQTAVNGFVKQLFTLVALVAVMFYQSFELSLIAFIGFPLAAYPIYKIGQKLRHLSFRNQEMAGNFASQMSDTLQYSKLVKAYNCENFEIKRMSMIVATMFKMGKKISRMSLIASPFTESLAGIGIAAVIWYGGQQV
ncbi:MAG TPA: ABC transporter transmembrane domain-containing protein, partial [Rickettsiales bacterium]|nr:ABC transporter transmembrane domain-containing protein [Rickettsiales bacterium]